MQRLERIAYEKVINTKIFGRAREIRKPVRSDFHDEMILRRWPRLPFISKLINKTGIVEYGNTLGNTVFKEVSPLTIPVLKVS